MTVIARRVRAVPVRTSDETWTCIVEMISTGDGALASQLEEAGHIAAMLIAEEHTASNPILLSGCGPQARLYTLHGPKAIDGINANEEALQVQASNEWELALPASGPDLALAAEGVEPLDHVTVYDTAASSASNHLRSMSDTAGRRAVDVDLSVLGG